LIIHSPKLAVIANGEYQTSVGFALGETICFESLKFITDRFGNLSLSPEGNDSGNVFMYRENLDWKYQDSLSSPLRVQLAIEGPHCSICAVKCTNGRGSQSGLEMEECS
jgi:hypothetical protein